MRKTALAARLAPWGGARRRWIRNEGFSRNGLLDWSRDVAGDAIFNPCCLARSFCSNRTLGGEGGDAAAVCPPSFLGSCLSNPSRDCKNEQI